MAQNWSWGTGGPNPWTAYTPPQQGQPSQFPRPYLPKKPPTPPTPPTTPGVPTPQPATPDYYRPPSKGGSSFQGGAMPTFDPMAFMAGLAGGGSGSSGSWQQYADKVQQYDPTKAVEDLRSSALLDAQRLGLQTAHAAGAGGFAANEMSTPFANTMDVGLEELNRKLQADIGQLELEAMSMNNDSYLKLAELAQSGDRDAQDAMLRIAGLGLEAQGQAWGQQQDLWQRSMDEKQFDESVRQFEADFGIKKEELGLRRSELDRQYTFDRERFEEDKRQFGEEMAFRREEARRQYLLELQRLYGNNNPGGSSGW